jgi:beta-fructofuranosidase
MALVLEDRWVWDLWLTRDGADHHLFFLQAPKSIGDPELRHWHASVGHAVSRDLVTWTELPTALVPGAPGEWDDASTWTGSVVRDGDGWAMLYTGTS